VVKTPDRRAAAAAVLALVGAACGGSSGGGVVDDDGTVKVLDVQSQVFTPRCALSGCHVGPDAPFGLDLSAGNAHGNLIEVPSAELPAHLRVEPHDAHDSYLYMKLAADPRILGDPMPAEGAPLGPGELALIEDWIEQGAQ
jgi:hypothetical protein